LRAFAVLLVVAFHADLPIPGGFIGVDVFFVISGFVITSMLVRQLEAGRMSFALFYARRFRRLLPALAVLTTATMLLSAALLSPLGSARHPTLRVAGRTA
jgi:peptidoglycan/LPS O-acetylase OafA/YrhL